MDYAEMALQLHKENKGKISVSSKIPLETREDLSTAYTPRSEERRVGKECGS